MLRLAVIAAACLVGACATPLASGTDPTAPTPAQIDEKVRLLMQREDVKGLALVVIRGGDVRHVGTYGVRNVEKNLPLGRNTVMYGASLTKTAVGYLVLTLVDDGLMDLDKPLASYLSRPVPEYEDFSDLAGDDRWRRITARHVLNHATGFANFRWLEPDQKLRFHAEPGTRYGYSGEGFYLLQLAIEEGLGIDLETEMQARVFEPLGLADTSLQWRADFANDLADGYKIDGALEIHDERSRPSAAGSMDTSIADQALLWSSMVNGDLLSRASRAEFVRPQLPITIAEQFPTLSERTDPRTSAVQLSAGVGVVTYRGEKGLGWFKGGHNDSTGNFAVCHATTRDCLVMLSNSVRAELIYPELASWIMGDSTIPFWWEYEHVE